MNTRDGMFWGDSALRLLLGSAATVLTLIVFYGVRSFERGQWYTLVATGVAAAVTYAVCRGWGTRSGGAIAILLSMVVAAPAPEHRVTVWSEALVMSLLVVLLSYLLTRFKIERPIIGRLILLGPLFALGAFLLTLVFRLAFFRVYVLEASGNNAIHLFRIGVGLAVGLEMAELVIRGYRRRMVASEGAVKPT